MSWTNPTEIQLTTYAANWLSRGVKSKAFLATFPDTEMTDATMWSSSSKFHKRDDVKKKVTEMQESLKSEVQSSLVMTLVEKRMELKRMKDEVLKPWEKEDGKKLPISPQQVTAAAKLIELDARLAGDFNEPDQDKDQFVIEVPPEDSPEDFVKLLSKPK